MKVAESKIQITNCLPNLDNEFVFQETKVSQNRDFWNMDCDIFFLIKTKKAPLKVPLKT